MKEFSNIFPSPPKLCYECENKQYQFLQFRKDNEDKMTREELNNALATKFNCCDQCTENTRKYFEKQNSSSLSPLTPLTVNLCCCKVKKSFLLKLLTYLNVIFWTLFDSLYVLFQILFCLHSSGIIEIPDQIFINNFRIPFKLAEQSFYTTVFNCFIGLIILEAASYFFYYMWRNTQYNLRSAFFFILGSATKIALGKVLFEKQQHEYQISFNSHTYIALALALLDIYLARRQLLSFKAQTPISRKNVATDTQSSYSRSQSQFEGENRWEDDCDDTVERDSDDNEESGMDVESNNEDGADSSFSEINLDKLKIKNDFSPKKSETYSRNNRNFTYPHQQQTGFQFSPQPSYQNSRQQQSPGNIFQSPTPFTQEQRQHTSPNIFQQRSPTVNHEYFRNLFDQNAQQEQQQQQFSPNNYQNSRRQPNHFWS